MARGGTDYMPRKDGDFSAWAQHYAEAVKAFYDAHGLDPGALAALDAALSAWNEAYPAHVAARAAAESACAAKNRCREDLEGAVRPVTHFVQGFPETTDADRAGLGITVRDTGRTPAPAPTTAPAALIDSGQRLTHRLRFTDAATPTRRARPRGTMGAEVWLALTAPGQPAPPMPAAPSQSPDAYRFLSLSPSGSLDATFPTTDAGKTAHYALRWVSTRGAKGPWGEVAAATVAA